MQQHSESIIQIPVNMSIHNRTVPFEEEILAFLEERRAAKPNTEKFAYFWRTHSPFSQWHRCRFTSGVTVWGEAEELKENFAGEREFSSAEQYMMFQKAILFSDAETAAKILQTHDVKRQKALGKQVKHFNEQTWKIYRAAIVARGNYAKFSQDETLRNALLATKGKTLVEAAPNDRIWGIGLVEEDPAARNRSTWKGKNLLGEILTYIRILLNSSNLNEFSFHRSRENLKDYNGSLSDAIIEERRSDE